MSILDNASANRVGQRQIAAQKAMSDRWVERILCNMELQFAVKALPLDATFMQIERVKMAAHAATRAHARWRYASQIPPLN